MKYGFAMLKVSKAGKKNVLLVKNYPTFQISQFSELQKIHSVSWIQNNLFHSVSTNEVILHKKNWIQA